MTMLRANLRNDLGRVEKRKGKFHCSHLVVFRGKKIHIMTVTIKVFWNKMGKALVVSRRLGVI